MPEELHDPVKVRADFDGGDITPLKFKWSGRTHAIARINTHWVDTLEGARRHCFSVTTDTGDVYELTFRTKDMVWVLERYLST